MSPKSKKEEALETGEAGPPELADVRTEEQAKEDAEIAALGKITAEDEPQVSKGKLTIEDRMHNLEIGFAQLERKLEVKIGLSRPLTPEETLDASKRSVQDRERKQKVAAEKELRKYVKRDGGFRKDLTKVQKARAKELLTALERRKPVFDLSLIP